MLRIKIQSKTQSKNYSKNILILLSNFKNKFKKMYFTNESIL